MSCTHAFADLDQLNKYKRHAEYWFYYHFDKQRNRKYSIPPDDEFQRFVNWISHEEFI